jgi:hypothetical protein
MEDASLSADAMFNQGMERLSISDAPPEPVPDPAVEAADHALAEKLGERCCSVVLPCISISAIESAYHPCFTCGGCAFHLPLTALLFCAGVAPCHALWAPHARIPRVGAAPLVV